ncbi:MAG: response regulator [Ardenticatenaceae bacterium]|nr:response regulator [Anaerolineales bacterium]MCB8939673.1 response regulator [Ardenticatenaceae bacterium]MCB8974902.1 response regulator [Ardenticatenaceae bacterium]
MKTPLALVVEDAGNLAEIFALALAAAGYQTITLNNGQDARQFLDTQIPDLLLLDIHLPQDNGDRLLADIRQLPHFAQMMIIVVTADSRRGEELRDVADFVLHKPISFAQLRDLSRRLTATMTHLHTGPFDQLWDEERP